MFQIEDELHAEPQRGTFETFGLALAEIRRLAAIPWDQAPNVAPCENWSTCGRSYEIVEYDNSAEPWSELRRIPVLRLSAKGLNWLLLDVKQ
jgi:hypothetical protein